MIGEKGRGRKHDTKFTRDNPRDDGKRRRNFRQKEYGAPLRDAKELKRHVGIFIAKQHGGHLASCHRKDPYPGFHLDHLQAKNFHEHDVVVYTVGKQDEFHLIRNLGSILTPKTYALMGIYAYNLPHAFSEDAVNLANKGTVPEIGMRTDLRHLPMVTIDGDDAKDFDDAVYAISDSDPRNPGGWRAVVAIADVSHYVQAGDAIDKEAYLRGNSVYFIDRVVPMLPERLSNDLCSLRPHEDRACLAVDMVITKDGKIKSYKFKRGLMRSVARLTYTQVENAVNGITDKITQPLLAEVIMPLYGCYQSLQKARDLRGTIQVETIENTFELDNEGGIKSVSAKQRLQSHQLIEEFMIAANVAAAKTLKAKNRPSIYRIHERPDNMRLQNLYTLARSLKLAVKKFSGSSIIGGINDLLKAAKDRPYFRLFNELVLRSQAQARYSSHNLGHFGLNLDAYCHFTSPIRRYADLVVHRSLIMALELGNEQFSQLDLDVIGEHISKTERTAMEAEREVNDRFMAHYMKDHLGGVFDGTIVGVGIPGLFVEIDQIGAQGFIPRQDLNGDYFVLNESLHCYIGRRTKKTYQIGNRVKIMVTNADPVICSIGFSIVKDKPSGPKHKYSDKPKQLSKLSIVKTQRSGYKKRSSSI